MMLFKITGFLFPLSLFFVLFTSAAKPQEFTEDEYISLRKQLCCYTNEAGKIIDYTGDTYSVVVSDKLDIDYTAPENLFTYEVKEDTMFFMNSVKLTKFLDALVLTLNQKYAKKLPILMENVVLHYNGHKIEVRYRTRKADFQLKNIDDGKIVFINWSGGFVLKTIGFKAFIHNL